MDLKLLNDKGETTASVAASDELFGREYNEALVHQLVVAYLANGRQGTRAQKARADINRSHRKPWRQKGTGRARAGFSGSPIWRGGGRIFPNLPEENFTHKVNKKMYRAGLASILSQLARAGRLMVVDDFRINEPKTKSLVKLLASMKLDEVMIVTDKVDENLYLSSRNLQNVMVVEAKQIDPYNLVRFSNVVVTRNGLKLIEEALA